jgi:mono/diheme cytochrome c family protein
MTHLQNTRRDIGLTHVALATLIVMGLWAAHEARAADAPNARPEPTAAVKRGKQLAQNICTACHVVELNQKEPPMLSKPAPSFLDIVNRPGVTKASLSKFLQTTHWDKEPDPAKMPNLMLMGDQASDVATYILSLRTAQ